MEESLKSLSLDYLNLLINGQAFSDVTFSVDGRLVHAHRCILAARSTFFRNFFCGTVSEHHHHYHHHHQAGAGAGAGGGGALHLLSPRSSPCSSPRSATGSIISNGGSVVVPVNSVSYEVFLLLLQFLYSGQVALVPPKNEPRPNCGDRGCWHTHCSSAVDLALDTLSAARAFGVDQLVLLTQVPN